MWWNVLLTFWIKRKSNKRLASKVYQMLVKVSRDQFLFEVVGLPDTPQGRFESVALHMFLLQRRLRDAESSGLLAQELMDKMADDLDHSIREMGVGDLSVGKNVKKLSQMVEHRFSLYEDCFDKSQEMNDALKEVFSIGVATSKIVEVNLLHSYLVSFVQKLNEYRDSDLITGSFSLPTFKDSDLYKNG